MPNSFLKYDTFLRLGIVKTTIVGTLFSIASSVLITIGMLKIAGIIPREHIIIAIVAPLIITPIVIVLFFKLIIQLQNALSEVKKLSGLLPICAHCKKIRDDKGYWNQIESYIHQHSEAKFSHGICEECAKKIYPNLDI